MGSKFSFRKELILKVNEWQIVEQREIDGKKYWSKKRGSDTLGLTKAEALQSLKAEAKTKGPKKKARKIVHAPIDRGRIIRESQRALLDEDTTEDAILYVEGRVDDVTTDAYNRVKKGIEDSDIAATEQKLDELLENGNITEFFHEDVMFYFEGNRDKNSIDSFHEFKSKLAELERAKGPKVFKKQNAGEVDKLTKEAKTSRQKTALGTVKNIIKALGSINPDIELLVHETEASYLEALGDKAKGTNGVLDTDGKIHLNLSRVESNTALHEAAHVVMAAYMKANPKAITDFKKQLEGILPKSDLESVNDFANEYEEDGQQEVDEEFVVEALSRIADGTIALDKTTLDKIKEFLRALAKKLGMVPNKIKLTGKEDVKAFAQKLTEAFTEGKVLNVKEDLEVLKPLEEQEQGGSGEVGTIKLQKNVKPAPSSTNDTRAFAGLIKDVDIKKFNGKKFITNMYDFTTAGEVDLGNGHKVNLFGGKSYVPFMMHKKGLKLGDVSNLAAFNTKENAEGFIKSSIESGANLFMPHSGTIEGSWQFQHSIFEALTNLALTDKILSKKELIDTFNEAIASKDGKGYFNQFNRRYKKSTGKSLKNFDSFKNNPSELLRLLDADNNYSPKLRKALNDKLSANVKFQEAIGVKNKPDFAKRMMDPMNEGVEGGELMGVVEFDNTTFEVKKTKQGDADHHPSFGWTVLAKIKGIFQPKDFHQSIDVTESYTKYNKSGVVVSKRTDATERQYELAKKGKSIDPKTGKLTRDKKTGKLKKTKPFVGTFEEFVESKFDQSNVSSSAGSQPKVAETNIETVANPAEHKIEGGKVKFQKSTREKKLFREPNKDVVNASEEYKKNNNIKKPAAKKIYELDLDNSLAIADAYEAMVDNPSDPKVKKAYTALANEVTDQFNALKDAGFEIEIFEGKGEPYVNSEALLNDLRDNKKLLVLSTEKDFGEGGLISKDNPMLQDSGLKDVNGKPLLVNDLFRFVHDVFGHGEQGTSFGAIGEENAWNVHSKLFSDDARRALTTETRGQNSWVNFGPQMRNADGSIKKKGDPGYLPASKRPFAKQKNGLLPDSMVFEAKPKFQKSTSEDTKDTRAYIADLKNDGFLGETSSEEILEDMADLGVDIDLEGVEALRNEALEIEAEVTKGEIETEAEDGTPISKQTARAAAMETDPVIQKKLKNIGKYDRSTFEGVSKYVDDMIETAGAEGAIINVRGDTKAKVEDKIAVLTEAGAVMVMESKAQMKEAIKSGDEKAAFEAKKAMERGYGYLNEASQWKTEAGQIISYTKNSYKKYPSVYMVNEINKFEGANKETLNKSYSVDSEGNIQTAQEAVQDVQTELSSKIEAVVDAEMERILNKIDVLEKENKDLSEELKKAKVKDSKTRKKNKVKKAKTKRANALDALRKASSGKSNEMSAGIIPLTNAQMEAIKDIVVSYIQEGAARTDLIISKVYNDVKGIIKNKKLSKDHIRNIAEQIAEFNAQVNLELENGAFESGDLLTAAEITKIAKEHYKGKNAYSRTLAQAIMSKTGLDAESAQSIADSIGDEMQPEIETLVRKEIKRFLAKGDDSTAELKKARREGKLTPEQEVELNTRIANSENQKIQAKIMKAINLGALSNGTEVLRAFEGKFGFKMIPETVKEKLLAMSDRLAEIEIETQKELVDKDGNTINDKDGNPKLINVRRVAEIAMIQKDFYTLLESQEPWSLPLVLKEAVSFQYISMLSGPLTLIRAFIGGYGSGIVGTISYNLRNLAGLNIKALGQGYKAAFKSLPAAWARARVARKTGYDFFGASAYKGGITTKSRSRVESALFNGLSDAINEGKIGKAAGKAVGQVLKAIHSLGAMDAFMVTVSGSFVGATEEYKAIAKKQKGKESMNVTTTELLKNKEINEAAFKKIASDEYADIVNDIESGVDLDIAKGELKKSKRESEIKRRVKKKIGVLGSATANPRRTYVTNRIQELREADMGDKFVEAVSLAKDATMMGEPDAVTGLLVSGLKKGLSIDPKKDSGTIAAMKLLLNGLFKFVRITGSVINKSFNNIPVLGIANAFLGPGYNPLTEEVDHHFLKGKWRANPLLVKQRIATNLLITAAITATLNEMYDWDDDDEEFKLDPDRKIDVRGFGFGGMGGYSKNKRLHEDWANLSFSVERDSSGNFTNYKSVVLIPELAAIAATTASFSDPDKDDSKGEGRGNISTLGALMPSMRVLENNIKIFTESSFSSIGHITKKFMMNEDVGEGVIEAGKGLLIDNIRPMINPSAAKSVTNFLQANAEMNQKQAGRDAFSENILKGAYGLDFFLKGEKTDLFGNKYPVESDPTRFLEILGKKEKRSEMFEKTVGLQYKFGRGLDLKKFKVRDWEKGKEFKVKKSDNSGYITAKSRVKGLDQEVLSLQQQKYKDLTIKYYDKLNSYETKEKLEKAMLIIQDVTKNKAEQEILKKYKDTNKIKIIK